LPKWWQLLQLPLKRGVRIIIAKRLNALFYFYNGWALFLKETHCLLPAFKFYGAFLFLSSFFFHPEKKIVLLAMGNKKVGVRRQNKRRASDSA